MGTMASAVGTRANYTEASLRLTLLCCVFSLPLPQDSIMNIIKIQQSKGDWSVK